MSSCDTIYLPEETMVAKIDELRAELRELGTTSPNRPEHELFVLWFVRAFFVDSSEEARTAVTGGSADKGIDAVYIDENSRNVFVVQGKYRINSRSWAGRFTGRMTSTGHLLRGSTRSWRRSWASRGNASVGATTG